MISCPALDCWEFEEQSKRQSELNLLSKICLQNYLLGSSDNGFETALQKGQLREDEVQFFNHFWYTFCPPIEN